MISQCNDCFGYQRNRLRIRLSLLGDTITVRKQCLVLDHIVLTLSILRS